MSRDFDRFSSGVQPREGVISSGMLAPIEAEGKTTHAPADIRGQV
jgi:hypothetical protein